MNLHCGPFGHHFGGDLFPPTFWELVSIKVHVHLGPLSSRLDHLQVALGQHHVVAAGQRESEDAAGAADFCLSGGEMAVFPNR